MRVISERNVVRPEDWIATVLCEAKDQHDPAGCGTQLEVTAKDLKLLYWKGSHFNHYYTAVKCPQCGKYNREKNVPDPIYKKMTSTERKRSKAIFDGFSDRE